MPTTLSSSAALRASCFAITVLGVLAMTPPARAEPEPEHPVKPLLWKIEGKGLAKPSYLFGTIHISKGPAVTLHPTARKAFDASTHFYAEVPMDMAGQLAAMPLMMRKDGKKLDESIGEVLAAEFNAELKRINPELDSTPFQILTTWAAAMLPQLLPHQLDGGKPLDLKLWEQAAAAGKKTAGMEKPAAQMLAFTELTEDEQIIFMAETLKTMKRERAEGRDGVKELIDAYITGEPEKIAEVMDRGIREMAEGAHKELGEQLMKRLLTDRDKLMTNFIVAALLEEPDGSHFFAAGAGHFISETNIATHLVAAGYTVTRVEE